MFENYSFDNYYFLKKIMANNSVQDTSKRTSQEQLDHYLHFLQENPDFLANKNDPTDPKKIKNYWDVLSRELNALRGPVRTAAKWKQTLTHWKHQLCSRTRKLKVYKNLTGGGPPPSERISTFEEKALEVLGAVAIDGLQTVPTIGCDDESTESSPATPTSVPSLTFEDITVNEPGNWTTPATSKAKGSAKTSTIDLCSKVVELCAKRYELEKSTQESNRELQLQILKNQEAISAALGKVGEGLAAISQLAETLINRLN